MPTLTPEQIEQRRREQRQRLATMDTSTPPPPLPVVPTRPIPTPHASTERLADALARLGNTAATSAPPPPRMPLPQEPSAPPPPHHHRRTRAATTTPRTHASTQPPSLVKFNFLREFTTSSLPLLVRHGAALAVWLVLYDLSYVHGTTLDVTISIWNLSNITGYDRRTITRNLALLERTGLLTRTHNSIRGSKRSNTYTLHAVATPST